MPSPGHKTAKGDGRTTPPELADATHRFFNNQLELDPCWNADSPIIAKRTIALPEDGLLVDWTKYRSFFVNGPWSDLLPWVEKCFVTASNVNCEGLFLARTESATRWAHALLASRNAHVDLHKRYCFPTAGEGPTTDTRPTTISYFGMDVDRFARSFDKLGTVYGPPYRSYKGV